MWTTPSPAHLHLFKQILVGTFNLVAQRLLFVDELAQINLKKDFESRPLFTHVSTDEVYGTLGETGLFTETTAYAPNSPYSASKASSDFFVRSYFHTYGMPVVTTNCSNNYGAHQHKEKLIPTIIRKALSGQVNSYLRKWKKSLEIGFM